MTDDWTRLVHMRNWMHELFDSMLDTKECELSILISHPNLLIQVARQWGGRWLSANGGGMVKFSLEEFEGPNSCSSLYVSKFQDMIAQIDEFTAGKTEPEKPTGPYYFKAQA